MIEKLVIENKSKILLLVLDGVGGLPINGKTELETARTPNLDELAKGASLGFFVPVLPGISPGSGPGHLALFGYDPKKYEIGRGILECLGLNMEVKKGDLTARGNFALMKNGIIIDRRAGRLDTEENKKLIKYLSDRINSIDDIEIILQSGKEHRFAVIFRGPGLSDKLTDADPHESGQPQTLAKAKDESAKKAEMVVNKFILLASDILSSFPEANTILLRGFSLPPDLPSINERFKLHPACVATYPMYKGIARLLGFEILDCGEKIEDQFDTVGKNFEKYDFFYVHIKKTDSYGEDGNFLGKVEVIEEVDRNLPMLTRLGFDVIAVTGDHSTPSLLKRHSWHPVPLLIKSPYAFPDDAQRFTERECAKGILGHIKGHHLMPILLANALKLDKFGA